MNLINYQDQNTLPEQVSVNKKNIEILADEVDKLGFEPKGPYDAEAEYEYNDVVEYNYAFYRMIKEDGTVTGVLPTNTTYWQAVTGNMRGPQGETGATGAQGPAGADGQNGTNGTNGQDGADGKNALAFTVALHGPQTPEVNGSYSVALTGLTREPEVNEVAPAIWYAENTLKTYIVICKFTSVNTTTAYFTATQVMLVTGAQGSNGKIALIYDRNISFTYGGSAEQLISQNLPIANFNREPELNEDFIAILNDSGILYQAQCEVQTKSGSYVTSIVANDITKISGNNGADGQDGQNGQDGITPLVAVGIQEINTLPIPNDTVSFLRVFVNRDVVVGDKYVAYFRCSLDNYVYCCEVEVTVIDSATAFTAKVKSEPQQLTGTQGAQGPAGTLEFVDVNASSGTLSDTDYNKIVNGAIVRYEITTGVFHYYVNSSEIGTSFILRRFDTPTQYTMTITKSTKAYIITNDKIQGGTLGATFATQGQVLTANGSGGCSWQNPSGTTLNKYTYTATNPSDSTVLSKFNAIFDGAISYKGTATLSLSDGYTYSIDVRNMDSISTTLSNIRAIGFKPGGGQGHVLSLKYDTNFGTTGYVDSTQITSGNITSITITYYATAQLH